MTKTEIEEMAAQMDREVVKLCKIDHPGVILLPAYFEAKIKEALKKQKGGICGKTCEKK